MSARVDQLEAEVEHLRQLLRTAACPHCAKREEQLAALRERCARAVLMVAMPSTAGLLRSAAECVRKVPLEAAENGQPVSPSRAARPPGA